MINQELISAVKRFSQENSEKDDIHGFPHVERVYETSVNMGEVLEANMLVIRFAALLHDIGRLRESQDAKKRNHAEISAEIAYKTLPTLVPNISDSDLANIIHCIKAHSFSNKVVADTLEAKILSDADKLDAIGVIGIYRTIGFTVKNGGGIEQVVTHLNEKILKLHELMYLDFSKKIAETRTEIVKKFYMILKNEI